MPKWRSSTPPGDDYVGRGASIIREFKQVFKNIYETEHEPSPIPHGLQWEKGEHKEGSLKSGWLLNPLSPRLGRIIHYSPQEPISPEKLEQYKNYTTQKICIQESPTIVYDYLYKYAEGVYSELSPNEDEMTLNTYQKYCIYTFYKKYYYPRDNPYPYAFRKYLTYCQIEGQSDEIEVGFTFPADKEGNVVLRCFLNRYQFLWKDTKYKELGQNTLTFSIPTPIGFRCILFYKDNFWLIFELAFSLTIEDFTFTDAWMVSGKKISKIKMYQCPLLGD